MLKKILLSSLLLNFLLSCSTEEQLDEISSTTSSLNAGRDYFLYSKEFADRFRLPSNGIENLTNGLLAIGLYLEKKNNDDVFLHCTLKLFINDDLDVAFPTSSRGSLKRWDKNSEAGFFMGTKTPEEEFDWVYDKFSTKAFNTLQVVSKKLDSNGVPKAVSDAGITSYDSQYLQGVAYISSNTSCSILNNEGTPYEVHIKKKNYQGVYGPATAGYDFKNQQENLIRFDIPNRLIYAVTPVIDAAFKEYIRNEEIRKVANDNIESKAKQSFVIPPRGKFDIKE